MSAKKSNDLESEVWAAISAFEQILEAMPTDRASLDALTDAYEQIGDHIKAKEYRVRLGGVLLEEGDAVAANQMLDKLRIYVDDDPDVETLVAQIEALAMPSIEPISVAKEDSDDVPKKKATPKGIKASFNMSEELAFAWNLMEAGKMSQEEYASVVQDLTEMSSSDDEKTVSVLHVLEHRVFKGLEKIIGFVAKQCETPIISLSSFEFKLDVFELLPPDFIVQCGAITFELLGGDVMVVVLNPYNHQLRKDIKALTDKKCHFFMTMPSDFDQHVEKGIEAIADKALNEEDDE
ncbi:MAG: hypothetical protein KAH23_02400 [Kiritimatiellae bacterium]|nr:hypothetical protein [Kiritimatiellia bacterium]